MLKAELLPALLTIEYFESFSAFILHGNLYQFLEIKITLYSCYEICPCTSLKPKCFVQRT